MLAMFILPASAQFKNEAFSNGFGDKDDVSSSKDSVESLFSFKEFFAGVGHKQELKIGSLFAGSMVMIGAEQIYNKQYWKLPIVYGGIGGAIAGGFVVRNSGGSKTLSNGLFAAAGAIYWGTLMDGVINYHSDNPHLPGRATLYSVLCPGLGQAYNGEYWKIPIYWGGLLASAHYLHLNSINYQRYRRIYKEASEPDYSGRIPAQTAQYYRDVYRRYRDYSILALAAVYLLQAIDANVFAFMQDFEVNEDLTMSISPTILTPDTGYAMAPTQSSAIGLSLGIRF